MRTFLIFALIAGTWDLVPPNGVIASADLFSKFVITIFVVAGIMMSILQDLKELVREDK